MYDNKYEKILLILLSIQLVLAIFLVIGSITAMVLILKGL
jgi:hypothetical protein